MSRPAALRVAAPAKVNLWLRVLGRRADGFHDLDTLFQAVDLCDEVEVVRSGRGGVELDVEGADLGPSADNLAHRAARSFLEALGPEGEGAGVRIRLLKRIPAGAGLGGGSSDAAAVLRAMGVLWGGDPVRPDLFRIAAALGSDVPFFLGPATLARGSGRGEVLQPLPPLPEAHLVLVLPPVHVATGPAYGMLARRRLGAARIRERASAREEPAPPGSWAELARLAVNDFEDVVPAAHPPVAASLAALPAAGARPALLSGSGGACFGVFHDAARAAEARAELASGLGWPVVAARTLAALAEPEPIAGGGGRPGVEAPRRPR